MNVLVLNADYSPRTTVGWEKAVTLLFAGKAETVEHYDRDIRTVSSKFKMPSIIRLLRYVAGRKFNVRFNKHNVYLRDQGRCQYCSKKLTKDEATFDHVIPRAKNGETNWDNVVISCAPCNAKKDRHTPEEVGMHLLTQPIRPSNISFDLNIYFNAKTFPDSWRDYLVLKE